MLCRRPAPKYENSASVVLYCCGLVWIAYTRDWNHSGVPAAP
jgi:hypothetical protein